MASEVLPVVDLRVLAQSDLDALAAASLHAVAPRSCPDADPLPPLKIDRAVFNESAGSRKQTFSRLRFAAAASSSLPTSPSSITPSAGNNPVNHLVAYHLRRLFAREDPSCPPSTPPQPETLALWSPDPDRETTNSKGVSVDLVRLAGLVDPYGEELRRQTAGLMSETELMDFINCLEGQWVSQRRRRKFVDAAFFGDHLPTGWKLQLGLKRKGRHAWVHCIRYVSPRGHQFRTCKEVSVYLMSLLGYPVAVTVPIQYNSTRQHALSDDDGEDDAVGFQHQIGSSVDNLNVLPVTSVTFSSRSCNSKDTVEGNTNPANTYKCQNCNLTLHNQSAYVQHQLLFHEKKAKRRRKSSKFGEPKVGKDGKFECPVCHKTFQEQSRYFGHVGAHARHEGLTPEAFFDKISSGQAVNNFLGELQFTPQELTEPTEQKGKTAGEACSHHQSYSKEQGGDNSKVIDLFSTNCSGSFNRRSEAWCRQVEVPPVTDARSACRYRNAMMDYANVTVPKPKVAPESNDEPNGRLNGFAEVDDFSDHTGRGHDFRPSSFSSAKHYEDQIVDCGFPVSKRGEVINTVKARDVNLNSCLDTISFPIASANNQTSTAVDEANQSSIAGKCFIGSFNNNDGASTTSSCSGSNNKVSGSLGGSNGSSNAARCIGGSYGNDAAANIFGNKNNTMVYQPSLNTCPISHVATNVDSFVSRSTHAKNSDKERAYNTKEQMNTTQNRASNEAVEGYNNDVYTGSITERSLAQCSNNLSHPKPNILSRCALPDSSTLTASNLTKGIDVNCMNGSFVYRNVANVEGPSVNRPMNNNDSMGSVHAVLGKPSNDMQNHYSGSAPNYTPLAAANINDLIPMQSNFDGMSTLVHSVGDVPRSSTTQDQCALQLGFGGQKQHVFPGYGWAAFGSPQLVGLARNNNLPTRSSQFGSMVRPNSSPSGSSQLGSVAGSDYLRTGSSQFGRMAGPSIPAAESSQFRHMDGHNSKHSAESSQYWHMAGTNCRPPAGSSQFGSGVRPNPVPSTEPSQFGSLARQNFGRTSEPTLVLGNVPQTGSGPPAQSGWDLKVPRMVSGGSMLAAVCTWCNSQFHHFGPVDGQQVGNYGLICPSCKDKVSGQRNMPNNGLWQP
ncbi:hypothetical protein ACQJBY_064701 [Aegilops geniculata]